jgi:Tol biopolymer transport system component
LALLQKRALSPFLCALLTVACNQDEGNPFAAGSPLGRLRPSAAIVFTSDAYAARPGSPRDVFAIDEDGSGMTRLTLCNADTRRCDSSEVAPAPDGRRLAIRRSTADTNGDGRVGPGDNESVVIADLQRGVEGKLQLRARSALAAGFINTERLSGLDWSPLDDILVYSANGEGAAGLDDLYSTVPRPDPNAELTRNRTFSAALRERRPRIDPTGGVMVYERLDAATGKTEIWIWNGSPSAHVRVTSGAESAGPALPGELYVVGSDADPDYSPDGSFLAFRRLTGVGNGGLGLWDVMTVRTNRTSLTTIASGPVSRSAPDWGPKGVVFSEVDRVSGLARLVVVQPDGSDRRVLATLNGYDIASPRWLPNIPAR